MNYDPILLQKNRKKNDEGALVPKLSSVFIEPNRPWGQETDENLASGNVSRIIIRDVILSPAELVKFSAIRIDYPLKKLLISNIFGAQTFGCIAGVLGNLSQSFKLIDDLDISNNAIGPNVALLLPLLKTATAINMNNCGISLEDFNAVVDIFSIDLSSLSCSRNYITGYPCIEHLHKLQSFNCSSCRIPAEDLDKLILTLSRLPSIRELNISDNGSSVKDDVVISFISKLSTWSEIEELSVADIGLKAYQSRWVLNTLKTCAHKNLTSLDMSFCKLKKIADLDDYFQTLPALKILNLSGNNLSKEISMKIARLLPNSQVICEEE